MKKFWFSLLLGCVFTCCSEQNISPSDLVLTDHLVEQVLELSFYGEDCKAFIFDVTSVPSDFAMDSVYLLESQGYRSG